MIEKIKTYIKLLFSNEKKFYYLIKKITGVKPNSISLYELALIHKSLINKTHNGQQENNERLEYLGDALLGAIVADYLYKKYPNADEGFLTKLRSAIVNRTNMNRIAVEMGLTELIKAQPVTNIEQTHIPGDALEAVIGAIYIDKGYDKTVRFIKSRIIDRTELKSKKNINKSNYKSFIIEWGQKNRCDVKFVTEESEVPNQNDQFVCFVYINQILAGKGIGNNKKESQQNAAKHAVKAIDKIQYISHN